MRVKRFLYTITPYIFAVIVILVGQKCSSGDKVFELLSAEKTGISFKNKLTENEKNNILVYEYFFNGGGVAIGDINNDGLEDIFFTANMESNALYLNEGNLKFKDISAHAGVKGRENGWSTGVTMVDINGDGLLDIYVCYSGRGSQDNRRNQLFINKGDNQFEERSGEYGLDDPSYSIQAAFFDYDKDGDLDMYLLNHNTEVIEEVDFDKARKVRDPYAGDKLYQNNNGKFVDISEEAGIKGNPLGFGLGVAVSDINMDGWPDIYISNDYIEQDYLYINNKDGTFTDNMEHYLEHISHFSMGSDIADVNNDGSPDIYTLDMLPEDNERQKLLYGPESFKYYKVMIERGFYHQYMRNMLHLNNSNGTFSEIGQLSGISNTDWSWCALFADYDNDGWKDLFVTNGYYRDYTDRDFLKYKNAYYFQKQINKEKADTFHLVSYMTSTPTHNYIFKNNGDLTFSDESDKWGFGKAGFSNGAAYSDLDNDGDLDLVVNNLNEHAGIYKNLTHENTSGRNTNFLTIDLVGKDKNTQAIGSKIYVYNDDRVQYFEQKTSRGFQSAVSDKIFVGLKNDKVVDSVVVVWPKGDKETIKNIKANQEIKVVEKPIEDKPNNKASIQRTLTVFEETFSPIQFRYIKAPFNDFDRQPLMITMLSNCGPIMTTEDLNNDGLKDVFIGGSYGSTGKILIQNDSLGFLSLPPFSNSSDRFCTDTDAVFIDVDNDSDKDLYIASGGYNNYRKYDSLLQDRLYLNDGRGIFKLAQQLLPKMYVSSSCVVPEDFDKDGDIDLFVGGRVIPGEYPAPPSSFLLENNGTGGFKDVMNQRIPEFSKRKGMVTDAEWSDINNDGWKDLIIVGEYMPVSVYLNRQGKSFEESTDQFFDHPLTGIWSKLTVADFDADGDDDLLVGNFGLNSQLQASEDKPIKLVYDDFDGNGTMDPIMQYYNGNKLYPYASRDEILSQLSDLKTKFSDYSTYANAQIDDILNEEALDQANHLYANTLETIYLENRNGKFVRHKLPIQIQFAPIYDIAVLDYNNDGHLDFIAVGNQSAIRLRLGKIDANFGQLFEGDGKGNFKYIPQKDSGLKFKGDVKSIKYMQIGKNNFLLAGINNVGIAAYKLRSGEPNIALK